MRISHSVGFKKKGFTLIEVILVVTVLAIVAVGGFYSYTGIIRSFGFLSDYKSVIGVIQDARSYAIGNKQIQSEVGGKLITYVPDRYGVQITSQTLNSPLPSEVSFFAEGPASTAPYQKDTGDTEVVSKITLSDYQFSFCELPSINLNCGQAGAVPLAPPLQIFFESGTGEVSIYKGSGASYAKIDKNTAILFSKKGTLDPALKKYIAIFKISGLAEEFNYPLTW